MAKPPWYQLKFLWSIEICPSHWKASFKWVVELFRVTTTSWSTIASNSQEKQTGEILGGSEHSVNFWCVVHAWSMRGNTKHYRGNPKHYRGKTKHCRGPEIANFSQFWIFKFWMFNFNFYQWGDWRSDFVHLLAAPTSKLWNFHDHLNWIKFEPL